jgi:cell division protein FtsW (lipid II flippase)
MIIFVEMVQVKCTSVNADTSVRFCLTNWPMLNSLLPSSGFLGILLGGNIYLNRFYRQADQFLLPLAGLLSGFGILMAIRLGPTLSPPIPALGIKQFLYTFVSMSVCLITLPVLCHIHLLARYKYTWVFLCLLLLMPSVINGITSFTSGLPTHDAILLGPIQFQPSEFLKISLTIFFAGYLDEHRDVIRGAFHAGRIYLPPFRRIGPMLLMLGVALSFFLLVRELGIALLIYVIFLALTYLGTGKLSYALVNMGILVLLAFIGYALFRYVRLRFATVGVNVVHWTAASQKAYNARGGALQIVQGLIALSSGGMLGAGLGLGSPGYVPVAQTDMVFTAFGEEFGWVGVIAILCVFLLLVYRGLRIALEATDTFSQLLAAGLTSIFAIQTVLICACDMNFLPLTGLPLPFLSAGGSSLITNFIMIGILLRISHNTAMQREGMKA